MGGGSPEKVPDETTADDDAAFENKDAAAVTLYKVYFAHNLKYQINQSAFHLLITFSEQVSDAGGSLNVETISTKPIRQEMLKSEVMAIDFMEKTMYFGNFNVCFM